MFWLNQISVKVCAFIYIFKDFHGCTDDVDINIKKKASALMYLTFILDLFKRKLEQKTTFFGGKKKTDSSKKFQTNSKTNFDIIPSEIPICSSGLMIGTQRAH
jgi:hypothetical protein